MRIGGWREGPIHKRHDREGFDCGEAALNEFLRRHARGSHKLGGAKTFLVIDDANEMVLGFCDLGVASFEFAQTPEVVW